MGERNCRCIRFAHAANRPDHPAVIMTGSGKQITYNEMDAESNRFTRLLRAHGVGAGDAFAVLLENRIEYFTLIWGFATCGHDAGTDFFAPDGARGCLHHPRRSDEAVDYLDLFRQRNWWISARNAPVSVCW